MASTGSDRFGNLEEVVAVATLPVGILAFIFLGWAPGITVFVVGWLLLVPLFSILSDRSDERTNEPIADASIAETDRNESDPLETLRERYARGEIDEAEFERRLEDLLETDPEEFASRVDEADRTRELERE